MSLKFLGLNSWAFGSASFGNGNNNKRNMFVCLGRAVAKARSPVGHRVNLKCL